MLGVDQITKAAVVARMEWGESVEVLGSLLKFTLVSNPGAAFGLGSGTTLVFSVFAVLVAVGLLVFGLPRMTQTWHAVALGLMLGGITGNLYDRITQPPSFMRGHVVDFFQLPYFAIFNVADICITSAAALIILMSFRGDRAERAAAASAAEAA
ncbi:signal peptidase II [Tessaracoccus caeni]|uniref:signal peptidase II n=1 Tax=Tessaracoccus caeni TaxID=3031239 RepID=UPI0023DAAD3C|nr:signal peptidase II [Tessaracoccus caeni]MDF1487897.1 signal peptidase II [Tessaracoccus caeni]